MKLPDHEGVGVPMCLHGMMLNSEKEQIYPITFFLSWLQIPQEYNIVFQHPITRHLLCLKTVLHATQFIKNYFGLK
jgi:hypothetical protein